MTALSPIGTNTGVTRAESRPIRIGCVSYLNTRPLIEGLEKLDRVELVPRPPAELASLLESGRLDVGLVSLIDAARSRVPLALLPEGAIASRGATLTVRLFSSVPIGSITRLHADTDSHTSVALVRIILDERFGVRPEIVPFDAREHRLLREQSPGMKSEASIWPESLLLIGDKVVTDAPPATLYPHTLDLGRTWRDMTGLPFVYATWMCSSERADDPRVRLARTLLDRQRRHNATRLGWIAARRSREHGWPRDLADTYLTEKLEFGVTDGSRLAVDAFLERAHGLGLADSISGVRWLGV